MATLKTGNHYYHGKYAVVTGAASGVGLALAETMLSYKAAGLVIADCNDEALARESARLSRAYPEKVVAFHCDVTSETQVQKMIRDAAEFYDGRIDLLFNNAGAGLGGLFDRQTNDEWMNAFAINFYGPIYGIRAVLPLMREQKSGHIISIISGIAFAPMAQQTMYSATKAALNALTLALRYEMWDENIRFTSATPGTTATGIWKSAGKEPPANAQSAEQSARTILAGVAQNERLVLGDKQDVLGAINSFNPATAATMDDYLLDVARRRRKGEVAV